MADVTDEWRVSVERAKTVARNRFYSVVSALYLRAAHDYQPNGFPPARVGMMLARVIRKHGCAVSYYPRMNVSRFQITWVQRRPFPDMSWLEDDMFLEDAVFPTDISYDSEGAEVFSTDVNSSDSGHEQRIAAWDQPLMEYDVAYGVRTMEQLHHLKKFFRVARGQKHAFRFRDPVDYTSSFAVGEEARRPDPVTPYDQSIATGDGIQTAFQLVKNYDYAGVPSQRVIEKPEPGTVRVAVNGHEYPAGTYTVDHTKGIVNLSSRANITFTGAIKMERLSATARRITWDAGEIVEDLFVGDWVQISGFDNAENRVPEAEAWQITNIDNDNMTMSFVVPDGYDQTLGVDETALAGTEIRVSVIAAPPRAANVTAGYQFHVPVRFSVDRLPINLEHYGVGSATQVTLTEVRGQS